MKNPKRTSLAVAVAASACLAVLAEPVPGGEPGHWSFPAKLDKFSPDARLDLSGLNEDVAGETGFIRLSEDGQSFLRGDGRPIRFWAVNTYVARKGSKAIRGKTIREHARFLAKRGVNMVRFHGQIPQTGKKSGEIEAINKDQRDQLWQLVAGMKEEGIYVTFSPYHPHAVGRETAARWTAPRDSKALVGLIYFDPVVQAAYLGWLRETLTPPNPLTGVPLKDEPALAVIQMQNEDSLLFWTLANVKGREARLLGFRFGVFLEEKYGSLKKAQAAWGGARAPGPIDEMEDEWDNGVIALAHPWHLTGDAKAGRAERRLRDQTEFLTRAMRDWHAEVARFLKEEIGAPQLFNPGNWKTADPVFLDDQERFSYAAGDVIGVNRYVAALHEGPHKGWAVVAGDRYREDGILHEPLALPAALKQPAGHAYLISETLWVPPMWKQSEGPLLMAAYQALTGVDASYWFAANEVQWREPGSANGYLPSIGKWYVSTPMHLGMFPAAALIFRQGLIAEAEPVVIERRAPEDLWARKTPLISADQGFDPNRDSGWLGLGIGRSDDDDQVDPMAFLAGPVQIEFEDAGESFVHEDLERLIDREGKTVASLNGQLKWDWGAGTVVLDAPGAQGVIGRLSARESFETKDATFSGASDYASVVAVPLDGLPLSQSRRVLLQTGTIARPTGWTSRPVEHEGEPARVVIDFGGPPWRIERLKAHLTIRNPGLSRAFALDENGLETGEVPTEKSDGALSLTLPEDKLYVILE